MDSLEAVLEQVAGSVGTAQAFDEVPNENAGRRDPVRQPLWRKVASVACDIAFVAAISLILGTSRHIPVTSQVFLSLAFPIAFYAAGLYERRVEGDLAMFLARLLFACFGVLVVVGSASYMVRSLLLPRSYLGIELLLVLSIFPWYRAALDGVMRAAAVPTRVAVLGAGKAGVALIEALSRSEDYVVCGVYDDDASKHGSIILGKRVLGASANILNATSRTRPDLIAVAVTHDKSRDLLQTLLECRRRGLRVTDMVAPYEQIMGRLPVQHLSDTWIAFWSNFNPAQQDLKWKLKRSGDVVGSLVLLTLFAIPLAIAGVLIKLGSPGPVFYKQKRVGRDGRTFQILKLRTMYQDAEKSGPQWASINDDRTTWIGRYLRRARLDEFPQLINVLRGDMSLTGPRPERPEFVHVLEKSIPHYGLRHMVKPGITGWAQVSYPYGASIFDSRMKLEYDLYYIRHMGPIFDLRILLRTIHALLFGGGR